MRNDLNSEPTDLWVDDQMKNLKPPSDWAPNTDRALDLLVKRNDARREVKSGRQWRHAALTVTLLATVFLVLALLPWRVLWSSITHPQVEKPAFSTTVGAVIARPSVSTEKVAAPVLPVVPAEPETIVTEVTQDAPPSSPAKTTQPRCTVSVEPQYTEEARQAGTQGTVILSGIVRKDGTTVVTRVVRGLGHGLDESAIAAFEKWQCQPGTVDGMPVDIDLNVQIKFTLR